jgi:hypothetical protein
MKRISHTKKRRTKRKSVMVTGMPASTAMNSINIPFVSIIFYKNM